MTNYHQNLPDHPRQAVFLFADVVSQIAEPESSLAMVVGGHGLGKSHALWYLCKELEKRLHLDENDIRLLRGNSVRQTQDGLLRFTENPDSWRVLIIDDFDQFFMTVAAETPSDLDRVTNLINSAANIALESRQTITPRKFVITSTHTKDIILQSSFEQSINAQHSDAGAIEDFSELVHQFPVYWLDPWELDWQQNIRLNVARMLTIEDDRHPLVATWTSTIGNLTLGHPALVAGCLNELARLRRKLAAGDTPADAESAPLAPYIREFVVTSEGIPDALPANLRKHLKLHLADNCFREIRREIRQLKNATDAEHASAYKELLRLAQDQKQFPPEGVRVEGGVAIARPELSMGARVILYRTGLVCRLSETGADAIPGTMILTEILEANEAPRDSGSYRLEKDASGKRGHLILRCGGGERAVELTGTTLAVAALIVEAGGAPVPFDDMMTRLHSSSTSSVRSAIQRLQAKLNDELGSTDFLQNKYRKGYRFDPGELP